MSFKISISKTANYLSKFKSFSSKLTLIAISSIALSSLFVSSINAYAGETLGAGASDTVIPAQVTEGRTGTDIRFRTNTGNVYAYTNGANNPAYTLTETNPAQGNTTEQGLRRLDSRHDLYVFHDRYEVENPDTNVGTMTYDMRFFCNTGCTNPTDVLEVVSVVNRWDTNGDPSLEQTDTLTGGRGIDTSTAGELHVSVTPFATCGGSSGACSPNATIDATNNYAGQFGWVTIVLGIKAGAPTTPATIDGLSTLTYTAFGAANGNVSRIYIAYGRSNDELDPNGNPSAVITGPSGSGTPSATDTTYSIVTGSTTPILGADGQPLNAPNGTCVVTVGSTTYTGTGITNGICTINGIPLASGTTTIPGGTVNISDGGTPRAITDTATYPAQNVGVNNPVVTVTSPTSGSNLPAGTPTNLTATVTNPSGGTVTGVTYFVDGNQVGTSTTGPNYSTSYTPPTTLTPGPHTITATATTSGGGTATSAPVTFNVTTPITSADVPGLTASCNPAQINSTTTCTFTLPPFRTLPTDFRLSIGNGTASGTCTANGSNVTCTGVNTGSTAGNQPIYGNTGGQRTATGETVLISDLPPVIRTGGALLTGLAALIAFSVTGLLAFRSIKRKKLNVKVN